jgi:hypothetical protein
MGKGQLVALHAFLRLQRLSFCPTATAGDHSQGITSSATDHLHISQSIYSEHKARSKKNSLKKIFYY